jgi:hypothetical protein
MSRPSYRATKEDRKLVRYLAAIGLRQEQIALVVRIRSPKTLRKHFRREIASGNAEAVASVARVAYGMAVSGDHPGMTQFWLTTVGGGGLPLGDPEQARLEPEEAGVADAEE